MKKQTAQKGVLYVTATPIGNASDMTLRALDILKTADAVACEDTRVTARLFSLHGISAPLIAYHDHNAAKVRPEIIERLKNGDSMAIVSDAGTPLVSDPGFKLVRACIEEDIPVTTLPGASAVLSALILSGLPSDRFLFQGFLPAKQAARQKVLRELADVPATLVFMESPGRLAKSLHDMAAVLGSRQASVSREITKLYEETRRDGLGVLAEHYKNSGAPKGEVMITVAPPMPDCSPDCPPDDLNLDQRIMETLQNNSVRDCVRLVTEQTGLPRHDVYQRVLRLKG